ncbi:hypothetical protein R8Z57_06585 [Microbacterium sp. M3]|uniref:Uncharacterized protein n=1 Tax=Microbacterium arthrosphaerae TaxID=792652 RepID=A0ABU4GZE6_9MICO|nr:MULTISPECIES: hypothetical protein [Microbacterium]MDW4572447.1 hypothetical protein [Microbacterium arthrosphaerae]MDW7606302.1 hypothetical protein [Microbacterium sp. M3]
MTEGRRRVGRVARLLAVVALGAGLVMIATGLLASSTIAAINGVLLMVGTMLLVGVTYAAVFAREEQLARRAPQLPRREERT